jgi:DNA-binding CsgD family transcriptional regulator
MMLTPTLENTFNSNLLPLTSKEREETVLMEFLNSNKQRFIQLKISP